MKLKCIIIDDEPIARKVIEEYVADIDFLELCGVAENPLKASALLNEHVADLLFLDIQMPKMNGLTFLKTTKNLPPVIMTTAFPEYALEGYELDVLDYLVKPIAFERFLKACNKARQNHERSNQTANNDEQADHFFVKCNNKFEKIFFSDLLFAEAASNYVLLQTKDRQLITYITFKGIAEQLPSTQFIRVHKSFIVSIAHIDNLDGEAIRIGKHNIPISRSMKEEVMERIVNKRLFKR